MHERTHQILDIWLDRDWHRSVLYALSGEGAKDDDILLVGAVVKGMVSELRGCLDDHENGVTRPPIKQMPSLLRKWTSAEDIRLAAGEVNVPDMEVVLAATRTLADDIRALLPHMATEPHLAVLRP